MNIFQNPHENRLRAGWRLLLQFILLILISGIINLGIYYLSPQTNVLIAVLAQFAGVVGSIWIAARYLDKRSVTDYGLQLTAGWWRDYLVGILIAIAAVGIMFAIEWSNHWIIFTGYGWTGQQAGTFLGGHLSFLGAMLLVGFHEELFSRGYQTLNLFEGLRYKAIGTRGATALAVLLTSCLFGFLHFYNPNATLVSTVNIIFAGIVLAVPFILTGQLGLSMGLHFSWNYVMAGIMGFPVSGMPVSSTILQIQQTGPEQWTGGTFGPEGGFIGWIGMAIMLGVSCVYIKITTRKLTLAPKFKNKQSQKVKSDEQAQ